MRNLITRTAVRQSAKTLGLVYCMLGLVLVTILPVVGLVRLQGERSGWELALVIPVLTVVALRNSSRHLSVTAWFGAVLGLLLIGTGVGHLLGVTSIARSVGGAYDSRYVFRITIGGILVCTGLINIAASRAILRGAVAAIALAEFRTVSLIAFLGLLLPLPDGGSNTFGFLVLNVGYLTLLTFDWVSRPTDSGRLASSLTAV